MQSTLFYAGYLPNDGLNEVQASSFRILENQCRNLNISFEAIFAADIPESHFESNITVRLRRNLGYDFGSWAELIGEKSFNDSDKLIFMNSSFIGPMFDATKFFETFVKSELDYLALTESLQIKSHFQSYFWAISGRVANDICFREFLNRPLAYNDRESAIQEKELELKNIIENLGYQASVVFPAGSLCSSEGNPSLEGAYKMIRAGVPFIKSNLHGLSNVLKLIESTAKFKKDRSQEELIAKLALH
jgi:hypothetical protein